MNWTDKIQVFREDCKEVMKRYPDNYFDLAIVDPPYGIGDWNKRGSNKKLYAGNNAEKVKTWDVKPNNDYFNELKRVSKNQIIWGANHFFDFLGNTKETIIWDKNNVGMHFNNFELAWSSGIKAANRIFRLSSSQVKEKLIHPTQKPVKLYKWLLQKYANEGDKIFDSHFGSGSIAIACHDLKFDLVGCEIDQDYYDLSYKRFKDHAAQLQIF